MIQRSSKVKCEKAFEFFIATPAISVDVKQDKCKTKYNIWTKVKMSVRLQSTLTPLSEKVKNSLFNNRYLM